MFGRIDNDGDGRIDHEVLRSFGASELSTAQCDDGIDNDGDGRIDFRVDAKSVLGDINCNGPATTTRAGREATSPDHAGSRFQFLLEFSPYSRRANQAGFAQAGGSVPRKLHQAAAMPLRAGGRGAYVSIFHGGNT